MGKENRGFASASPKRRLELSKQGVDAALQSAHRHRYASGEEALKASQKGVETRRTNHVLKLIRRREDWREAIEVGMVVYRVHQVPNFGFWFNGIRYPAGSWLVWEEDEGEECVRAMMDDYYQRWRAS